MTNDHTQFRSPDLDKFLAKFIEHKPEEHHHKKVLIIRHGQSFGNLKRVWYGSSDFELTPKGITQAKNMHKALSPLVKAVDVVIATGLKRSQQTAKIIFDLDDPLEKLVHGYKSQREKTIFRIDKRFNEYDLGPLEGIDVSGMTAAEEEFLCKLYLEGKMVRHDIEQPAALLERIGAGFGELEAGKNNVIVAHYGVLNVLLHQLGFFGVQISTGDCLHLDVAQDGTPHQLVGYWAK